MLLINSQIIFENPNFIGYLTSGFVNNLGYLPQYILLLNI